MLSAQSYRRIARASAWYDLAIALPFATPPTLAITWALLGRMETRLGLAPLPELTVYGALFANFFGTVVLVWSVLRLRGDAVQLGRYDAVGRGIFAVWMLVALSRGASPLIWVFFALETAFGIVQALPVTKARNPHAPPQTPA
ncbi:MAG: hypothetical protein K0B00_12705 [Rhodobacteraceae bacterium]|nr:hypothetical protein [Paracoccaceae bacterium]